MTKSKQSAKSSKNNSIEAKVEPILKKVDQVGALAAKWGLNNHINRHELIGKLMFAKTRIDGERTRLQIKADKYKRMVKKFVPSKSI